MKKFGLISRPTAFIAAIAIAGCSQGPVAPSNRNEVVAQPGGADGTSTGSAAGDVKSGPIEIDLVRVGQASGVPAFYAFANGEYTVWANREVEIYVQIWTANPAVATVPRLIVDWGAGEADNIHCGPCRLSRTYRTEGRYSVKVTMDDRAGGITSRTFTFNVRAAASTSFVNRTPIIIPDSGASTPYPSALLVSGLGRIQSATVTIHGYSHTYHDDVVILLVAPNGQTVKLMDDAGGSRNADNANVTFQDGAPAFQVADIGPGDFTYSPTQESDTTMAPPAPNQADGATLSTLNGADPNGVWRLFVYDSAGGDQGQIAGGWSLTLSTSTSASTAGVQASSAGVVSARWPNEHILNAPNQKPDRD